MTRAIHSHVPGKKPWVGRKTRGKRVGEGTKFESFCRRSGRTRKGERARAKFSLHVSTVTPVVSLNPTSASTVASHPPFISLLVMVGDDRSDILGGDKLPVGRYQPPSYWSTLSGVAKVSLYSVTFLLSALFLRTFYHRFLRWRETNYRK